jgi:TolA-binding protein
VGQYDKAIEEFLAVAREYDDTSYRMRAVMRVGDVYYRQQEYERAISYYQRALRVPSEPWWPEDSKEDYARSDYMIGVCYFDQHSFNPMFAHFRRFVKKYPDSQFVDQAYNFIGRGNMQMDRYGQAIEAFQMVGTASLTKKAGGTIAPGEDLYLRVTDEDVGLASKQGRLAVRLKTSSGDKEMVYLESLGLGSPVFLGTIKTRLGAPRLTRALDEAYSAEVRRQIEDLLASATEMKKEAGRVQQDLREVEGQLEEARRAVRNTEGTGEEGEDVQLSPEQKEARQKVQRLETQVENLQKRVDELVEGAKDVRKEAYGRLDGAYREIEGILNQWDVAQLEEKKAGEQTETEKEEGEKEKQDTLSDVFTPQQIAEVRRAIDESPTTEDTYRFRRAVLDYWHQQLLREYKTLDLTGDDDIAVEYLDKHGSEEDEVIREDHLGVASDGSVVCLGPDLQSIVYAVIFGDEVRVRVEDPDMDHTDEPDTVKVVVSSIPKEKIKAAREEEGEGVEEDEEGPSVEVFETGEEEEEEKPPLVPEGAPSMELELTETAPHSGRFIGRLPTIAPGPDSPVAKLKLSPQRVIRLAYADQKTSSHEGEWVAAIQADIVPGSEGEQEVIEKQESKLDRRSELEKGIALGKLARVYQDLGLRAEAGQTFDEALKVVKKVATAERDSALGEEATYQMWDLYFASGQEEAAAEACQKLIRTFPDSPLADDALLIMGKAEEHAREAVKHFGRLVQKYPDSPLAPEAQYRMAEMKQEMGRFDVSSFEACANKFPGSNYAAKSLLRLAEYYVKNRDYERAKDYLERITLDFPDFDRLDKTTYMRGVCAYRMGNIQLSYNLMHEVIEKYPGTSVASSAGKIVKLLAKKLKR